MEGAAIDSVINPLACPTTLSTCARATAGVLQMSNSRWFGRIALDSSSRARNQSSLTINCMLRTHTIIMYQTHPSTALTAASPMCYNLQTRNNKPMQICDNMSCIILQKKWAHTPRMVNGIIMSNRKWQHACRTKFVHTCKNDHVGRFLNHAHTHVDNNTVVAKTPSLSQKHW